MEKVYSFPDFVMYLMSSFCISFSLCANFNASDMVSFKDNSFAPRECNGRHDFKYFKTCSISDINVYLEREAHRFAMPFIKFLIGGWFLVVNEKSLLWKPIWLTFGCLWPKMNIPTDTGELDILE